ncbi:uncharacterized protein LOC133183238 [Saccostrea echinata]|uniref:uncharacterized protein LOC133183238 n=1 Tax=Saccostrea echinata TaxID=191078 RepID=UPI002A80846B|nr:uncharacterized protein LOC133183238 [Saccostrea echinata]
MQGLWCRLSTRGALPIGRSSHGFVIINKNAYVFGGEHSPRVPIGSTVHCLNLETQEWSVCQPKNKENEPKPINAAAVASIGDCMYVFGGRSGITMGEGDTNDMYSFNTSTKEWSKLATSGEVPLARSFHSMTAMENSLYVFGGCSEKGRLNDLYCLDVATNQWEKQPSYDVIEGRGGPGLVAVGKTLYVVAGFAGREMNDVHAFDTKSKTWQTLTFLTPLPPRSVFGVVSHGTNIIVVGGEVDPSDKGHEGAGNFSNDTFILDTSVPQKWVKVAVQGDVPEPRGWFTAAFSDEDERLYIFGGNSETNSRLNDAYSFQLMK